MARSDTYQSIRHIADKICNEQATPEDVKKLEALLLDDSDAQQFYFDYISVHLQLLPSSGPDWEIVQRKIALEETIIRPVSGPLAGSVSGSISGNVSRSALPSSPSSPSALGPVTSENTSSDIFASANTNAKDTAGAEHSDNATDSKAADSASIGSILNKGQGLWWLTALALCILVAIVWFSPDKGADSSYYARLVSGNISAVDVGQVSGQHLSAGEYSSGQGAVLRMANGDSLNLSSNTRFRLFNRSEIALYQGQLTLVVNEANRAEAENNNRQPSNLKINGPSFTLFSQGSDVSLTVQPNKVQVNTGQQTLLVPKRWRPQHFWSFDGQTDRALDTAGEAHGIAASGAQRVTGLVGEGAFYFDNTASARINVGSGGGTAPATGSFAVTDGVTIESVIQPKYNGLPGELDEIFRKDQTDRDLRMILSFQNDKDKYFLRPEGEYDESLSFGLFLVGQGYHELKLPLDGQDGRPSLADLKNGQSHHVVATYNARTGRKAIYINGQMHASYQYPPGSKMLSGGAGMANIGNSPNNMLHPGEAYSGVIDEVAFYDFALPSLVIEQHHQWLSKGYNYFGLAPSAGPLPSNWSMPLPAQQTLLLDPITGLPMRP